MTLHVVALSGGKDSTCLALALKEREPRDYAYVCTSTGDELPDMMAHWNNLEILLSKEITRVEVLGGLGKLIADQHALPNFRQRWCTRILKIEPYRKWREAQAETQNVVSYVGVRYDEPGRAGGNFDDIDGVETRYPLREWKWGLTEVWGFLDERGIKIPKRTDCARCYHQQLGEWWALWSEHPDLYASAITQEDATGFTFRSPRRDTWPVGLRDLSNAFKEKGPPVRSMNMAATRAENRAQCRVCSI